VRDFKSFRFRYLFQENIMKHLTHQKEEKYAELIFNFCSGQTYYPNSSLVEHYSNTVCTDRSEAHKASRYVSLCKTCESTLK
jgi:hypothetical protein